MNLQVPRALGISGLDFAQQKYHQKPPTPKRNVKTTETREFSPRCEFFSAISGEDLQIEITNQGTELFSSFPKKSWGGIFFKS